MIEATSLQALRQLPGPVHVAIGVFDGLHLGHQAVIRQALSHGPSSAVISFEPHPLSVLRPESAPPRLTPPSHQVALLREMGVPLFIALPFTHEFASQSAEAFSLALKEAAGSLGCISVGENWRFGHKALGDVALLRKLGLIVEPVAPVLDEDMPVSSTRVREALSRFDFATAARLLGRPWSIRGVVEKGQQLGRTIGFPTANIHLESDPPLPNSVSVVSVRHKERCLRAVANLGRRPTVSAEAPRTLEVHIPDFEADLYGEELDVHFIDHLRPEQKFPNLDALKAQIAQDIAKAKSFYSTRTR